MRYDVTIVHSSVPSQEARHGDWVPRAVGWKRKTHIHNLSGANAYVIVSNHRVALLKHLDIDRIGSVDVEHTGDGDKTQEFRVMSGGDRKVRRSTTPTRPCPLVASAATTPGCAFRARGSCGSGREGCS